MDKIRHECVPAERIEQRIAVDHECEDITKKICINHWEEQEDGSKLWVCSGRYDTVVEEVCKYVHSLYNKTVEYTKCEEVAYKECHWEKEQVDMDVVKSNCLREPRADCQKIVVPDCITHHTRIPVSVFESKRVPICIRL